MKTETLCLMLGCCSLLFGALFIRNWKESNIFIEKLKYNPTISNQSLFFNSNLSKIDQVTITIKTTGRFHRERLDLLLATWIKKVLKQV